MRNHFPPLSRLVISLVSTLRRSNPLSKCGVAFFAALVVSAFSVLNLSAQEAPSRSLLIYYSWGGDTERVVHHLQTMTKGDLLRVKPAVPYPSDYRETVNRAKEEKNALYDEGIYPDVKVSDEKVDPDDYDRIFICYPLWLGKMAFPMQSFLKSEAEQLKGKEVAIVVLSGKSDGEKTRPDFERLCPDAKPLGLLTIRRADKERESDLLRDFLESLAGPQESQK